MPLVQPVKEVHQFTAERMSELAGLGRAGWRAGVCAPGCAAGGGGQDPGHMGAWA